MVCVFSGDFFDDEVVDKDDVEDDGEFGVEVVWVCELENGWDVWVLKGDIEVVFLLGIVYINFGFFDEFRFVGKGNDEGGGVEIWVLCWIVVDIGVKCDLRLWLVGWMLFFLGVFLVGFLVVMFDNL